MEKFNLTRDIWTIEHIKPFEKYLKSFSKGEDKAVWEKRIVNTHLPCLAIPAYEIKRISRDISKGNFMSYLDLWLWNNHSETTIIGALICKIKDFDLQKKYLIKYSHSADNWATIDAIKLKIKPKDEQKYVCFAKELVKDSHPFTRRLGLIIMLKIVSERTIGDIFEVSESLFEEQEYYVNMALAWLLAECFTKCRDKTLEFLLRAKLNKFVVNKAISKCRDSFRVSVQDKEMLIKFRK